ncbi:F-box only protein 43 [Crotalus adamanteus]|uniref:F-box only protein 43 n=1 Tax=Crotalus adamanteus TaxID=8729 RepID=A0AAW1BMY0_CROAD
MTSILGNACTIVECLFYLQSPCEPTRRIIESLYSMWKVSRNWREIVVHDKHANRRRKLYIKQLRVDAKGCLLDTENAASKFMVTRFALRPVQAQAKSVVLQMHSSCKESLTPIQCSPNFQSRSKQEAYIKVAQTLFSDEALKPCPRCQCPAKYQSLKKRGLCSREDCAFDFCSREASALPLTTNVRVWGQQLPSSPSRIVTRSSIATQLRCETTQTRLSAKCKLLASLVRSKFGLKFAAGSLFNGPSGGVLCFPLSPALAGEE